LAAGATVFVFDIELADADRNVYQTLALRIARHPYETNEYLLTRVLAYCLEYTEGIAFSSGGCRIRMRKTPKTPRCPKRHGVRFAHLQIWNRATSLNLAT
jgi:uncharacterized protein YaeQ